MGVEQLDFFTSFDVQRFDQFGAEDCGNWYQVGGKKTKKPMAMYPALGRKHITSGGENRMSFDGEPSQIFRSLNFLYVVVGTQVFQVNKFWNQTLLGNIPLGKKTWFDYLVVGDTTYCILTAETTMYLIVEQAGGSVIYEEITDPNAPANPQFVAAFGDRFVVSEKDTPDYYLSQINLGGTYGGTTANTCFTVNGAALFNRATGIVRQFAVLHAQLYIFNDFNTDIWANIPTQITVAGATQEFPWKKNNSYNFNLGMADPFSLSVGFGRMAWFAKNINGLYSFVVSNGGMPQEISTEAVDVLLENSREDEELDQLSPFVKGPCNGFLYQWENTVFYRVSAGDYKDFQKLDYEKDARCIDFNFNTQTWARAIELNGERNRSQKHVFFNNKNIITVQDDNALYELSGNVYRNELRDPTVALQDTNAFVKFPMRYIAVTQQYFMEDYSEFITDYLEIDFVFGHKTFYKNDNVFDNTIFIISEDDGPGNCPIFHVTEDDVNGEPVFIVLERGNTPSFSDNHYNSLFKPHIGLYWSDDGGVTYHFADVREFSQLGNYRWRMRWYELGPSRNRRYKLLCVSSAPIVLLGATHSIRRSSGGAN